jgi:hypothetical protein
MCVRVCACSEILHIYDSRRSGLMQNEHRD